MQPLIIDLKGKKVVIVGGGKIAYRKAKVLEEEGANITFISPEFKEDVLKFALEKGYELVLRKAKVADFQEALLVILATNDTEGNQELAKALPKHQLVCVVDDANQGNVLFPATVRRGNLQIAVTSNGASPKLTRKLKKDFEQQFDESWIDYTAFLATARQQILQSKLTFEEKQAVLLEILDERYRVKSEERQKKLDEVGGWIRS